MRARPVGLPAALLALALGGCGGPPPVPSDADVTPTLLASASLDIGPVRRILREGLDQVPTDDLISRVHEQLARHGAATIRVPHDDHVHHYTLVWVAGARTLVFFERTGEGVERLLAWSVN